MMSCDVLIVCLTVLSHIGISRLIAYRMSEQLAFLYLLVALIINHLWLVPLIQPPTAAINQPRRNKFMYGLSEKRSEECHHLLESEKEVEDRVVRELVALLDAMMAGYPRPENPHLMYDLYLLAPHLIGRPPTAELFNALLQYGMDADPEHLKHWIRTLMDHQ